MAIVKRSAGFYFQLTSDAAIVDTVTVSFGKLNTDAYFRSGFFSLSIQPEDENGVVDPVNIKRFEEYISVYGYITNQSASLHSPATVTASGIIVSLLSNNIVLQNGLVFTNVADDMILKSNKLLNFVMPIVADLRNFGVGVNFNANGLIHIEYDTVMFGGRTR